MVRILLILITILAIIGSVYFFGIKKILPASKTSVSSPRQVPVSTIQFASSSASVSDQFQSVEEAITTTDVKLNTLSDTVSSLQDKVNSLSSSQPSASPSPTSSTPAAATKQPTLYIPLDWTVSSTALDYTTATNQEITIDTADYPGYTSMQLQLNLRVYEGNGQAYARLYDVTDSNAILSSEVSTTSQDYNWVTSSKFTIPSGSKVYALQLKTLTGYSDDVSSARIKVNF